MSLTLMLFLNDIDYDAYDHVKKSEGGKEDKADIKSPTHFIYRHCFVHHIRPVLECHYPKKRQQTNGNITPEVRINGSKKSGAHSGVYVENNLMTHKNSNNLGSE